MDDLDTIKSAVESLLTANEILLNNGYCDVTHDSRNNRNYIQAVDYGLIPIIKSNKLQYKISPGRWGNSHELEIACDDIKAFAITTIQTVLREKLITKKKLNDLLEIK